jgi:hypothetical protein
VREECGRAGGAERRGIGKGLFPDPQGFIGKWGRAREKWNERDASGMDLGKDQELERHFFCRGYYCCAYYTGNQGRAQSGLG